MGGPSRTQAEVAPRSSQNSTTDGDHTTTVASGHTERLTQVETRSASHDQELSRMSARARVLEVRVQVLEHERERYETTLTTTRAELADAVGRIASLREDMGEMRGRVSSAEALAHAAAGSAEDSI